MVPPPPPRASSPSARHICFPTFLLLPGRLLVSLHRIVPGKGTRAPSVSCSPGSIRQIGALDRHKGAPTKPSIAALPFRARPRARRERARDRGPLAGPRAHANPDLRRENSLVSFFSRLALPPGHRDLSAFSPHAVAAVSDRSSRSLSRGPATW